MKNGHNQLSRQEAIIQLMNELEKGKRSGEKEGIFTAEEVRKYFMGKTNEKHD